MEVPAKPAEALEAKATNATAAAQGGGPKGGDYGWIHPGLFFVKKHSLKIGGCSPKKKVIWHQEHHWEAVDLGYTMVYPPFLEIPKSEAS